jgi:hypothetical protein
MALKSVTELKQERGWERNSHIEDLLCQKLGRHVFKREREREKNPFETGGSILTVNHTTLFIQ